MSAESNAAWTPDRIHALRLHLGLSQDDAAQQVGTRCSTWSRWERGEQEPSRYFGRELDKLASESGFATAAEVGR